MDIENIKFYPDPILYVITERVTEITEDVFQLGENLLSTLIESNGIGLAAPQIGISLKAIVVRDIQEKTEKSYFALNPEIVNNSSEIIDSWEGCLSFPGLNIVVKRYSEVDVKFLNARSEVEYLHCTGLLSRAFQHEIDHVNNILLIDRMSNTQKKKHKGYFKSLMLLQKKLVRKLKEG